MSKIELIAAIARKTERKRAECGKLFGRLHTAVSSACLMLANSCSWVILIAAALTGLGLAPIFPLADSQYAQSRKGEKFAAPIFSAGEIGGPLVPTIVGYASEVSGSLHIPVAIAPVLIVTIFLIWDTSGLGQRGAQ